MIVIIEGIDGTGKTSLAKQFEDEYGFEYYHTSEPDAHPYIFYTSNILDYIPGGGRNIVLDRWHISEQVYPYTRRNSVTDMTTDVFTTVDTWLYDKGAVLLHCFGTPYMVKKILRDRNEDWPMLDAERRLYEEVISRSKLPCIDVSLDRTLSDGFRDISGIVSWATRREAMFAI